MEIRFSKETRKQMVKAIEEVTAQRAKYLGVPSCAYQIADYRLEKDGTLKWEDSIDDKESREVIEACIKATGITPEGLEMQEENKEGTPDQIDLTVEIPLEKVSVENLGKIIDAKGKLIQKALGIENCHIEADPEIVRFPWFHDIDPSKAKAYTDFISALCEMSIKQKRVTATEKETDNEKYAFRCFLLRLGFIGKEYKNDRKILLENLEGSAAFKSGQKGGDE